MNVTLESSILQMVVFLVDDQRYALPVLSVDRVLPMVAVTPLPKLPAAALGVINVHGQVIPILDIRHRLGFPPKAYGLETHLLVARTTRRTVALPVDEVLGVREIQAEDVTSPEAVLPGINHVAGIVTLSDGLLFIHDLNTFFSLDEEQQVGSALGEMAR